MKTALPPLDPDLHRDLQPMPVAGHRHDLVEVERHLMAGVDVHLRDELYTDLAGMALAHDSVAMIELLF